MDSLINFQWSIKLDNGEIFMVQAKTAEELGLAIEEIKSKFLSGEKKPAVEQRSEPYPSDKVVENFCNIHKVEMKERIAKTGKKYFDHRRNFGTFDHPQWDVCYGEGFKEH